VTALLDNLTIRLATVNDFEQYVNLLQITYETCSTNSSLGLTKECFSTEMMATDESVKYLHSYLEITPTHKAWIAEIDGKIIGAITCEVRSQFEAEIVAFYVHPQYQHQGVGKKLYAKALDFAGQRDVMLDVYAHSTHVIAMYKKWGWKLDESRGEHGTFLLHWRGWPNNVHVPCVYLRLNQHIKL